MQEFWRCVWRVSSSPHFSNGSFGACPFLEHVFMSLLLDVFLPTKCLYCSKIGIRVCLGCHNTVGSDPRLAIRGSLIGFSTMGYTDDAKKILRAFKELGESELAATLASAMVPLLGCFETSPTLLVPIPSNKTSMRERGFNPAELLAREITIRTQGLRWANVLQRNRETSDQSKLSPEARRRNQTGSMLARSGSREVLLIDDVVTTGATLLEAEQTLLNAGYFVTGFITFAETEANRSMLSSQATLA